MLIKCVSSILMNFEGITLRDRLGSDILYRRERHPVYSSPLQKMSVSLVLTYLQCNKAVDTTANED
jgi:hypothetical protein